VTKEHSPIALEGEDWAYFRLNGPVEESGSLPKPNGVNTDSTILVDASGVERINSPGVRMWIAWMEQLSDNRTDVILLNCSPAIVGQLNLSEKFAHHTYVLSYNAPYFCETCDQELLVPLTVSDTNNLERSAAPPKTCEVCKSNLAFDDIEESFFAFARRAPQPGVTLRQRISTCLEQIYTKLDESVDQDVVYRQLKIEARRRQNGISESQHAQDSTDDGDTTGSSRRDTLFFFAIGALTAILSLVVYHLVQA
jgi:hypothetical protein